MGIRTNCPNGHPLNLKSFLAGKVGICPECGARFRITAVADVANGASQIASQILASGDVWYVCTAKRQQFGPLSAQVVREWLVQGRITPSCLVWCEGWPAWRSGQVLLAADAGPDATSPPTQTVGLSAADVPSALPMPRPADGGNTAVPEGVSSITADHVNQSRYRRRRQRSLSTTLTVVTILSVLSVALFLGLMRMLF